MVCVSLSVCVDAVWRDFMAYLVEKYGKTQGGIISEEIQNAIKLMISKGRTAPRSNE